MTKENGEIKFYYLQSLSEIFRESSASPQAIEYISNTVYDAYETVREKLQISYPVFLKASNRWQIPLLFDKNEQSLTLAYFYPDIGTNGEISAGSIILNHVSLGLYTEYIDKQYTDGNYLTPWQLIIDISHEMRHAYQWDQNLELMKNGDPDPYEASKYEYDANLFAYEHLRHIQPKNLKDRISKYGHIISLRDKLRRIKNNRKKLNLPV